MRPIDQSAWAMLPKSYHALAEFAAVNPKLSIEECWAKMTGSTANRLSPQSAPSAVAIISIIGAFAYPTIKRVTSAFRQSLADPSVKAIVFEFDSPGGTVDGIPELADEIYSARSQKKTVAVANTMAASAAYWLASAAGELVVTASGWVGSIGIFSAHEDISRALENEGIKVSLVSAGKYKTDGNPYEPLGDSARTDMQSKVNAFYEKFVGSVARGRNVASSAVRQGFGQGRMVLASAAVNEKMADRVGTLDSTLARLGVGGNPRSVAALRAQLDDFEMQTWRP